MSSTFFKKNYFLRKHTFSRIFAICSVFSCFLAKFLLNFVRVVQNANWILYVFCAAIPTATS